MENTKVITRGLTRERIKRRDKLRQAYQIIGIVLTFSVILIMSIAGIAIRQGTTIGVQSDKIDELVEKNKKLQQELAVANNLTTTYEASIEQSHDVIEKLQGGLTASKETIDELSSNLETLKQDNLDLVSDNKKLLKEVNTLGNKVTLYEKYNYAVFDKAKNRTGLTYNQLKLGDELMTEKGYDPDLLFGIIMVESSGNPKAQNSSSSAKGYGQFLQGTGKYVYKDLLKMGGVYNHSSIALDGDTNIRMMVAYIDYLYKLHNGNIFNVIKNYSGRGTSAAHSYIRRLNSYVSTVGKNVYDMNVVINK